MAGLSIVDFVRDSLQKSAAALPTSNEVAALLANVDKATLLSALTGNRIADAVGPPISEASYVTNAARLLTAFQATGEMTARQAFDAAQLTDFPTCRRALQQMTRRGLIHVTGQDPKYSDDIYALTRTRSA